MSDDKLDADMLRGIVEAILMTAEEPVSPGKLTSLCKGATGKDLRRAVDELNSKYSEGEHAMAITEIAGGFQFVTRKQFGPWVRKFHDRSHVRLSQAALETLAIIAFKQPVTRIEVDSVRGVDSGGVMRTILELNMVRIVGRSEGVGRPILFGTTREFMSHFGLKSLAELPRPKELEELLAAGERKALDRNRAQTQDASTTAAISTDGEPDDELADKTLPVAMHEDGAAGAEPPQAQAEIDDDTEGDEEDVDEKTTRDEG